MLVAYCASTITSRTLAVLRCQSIQVAGAGWALDFVIHILLDDQSLAVNMQSPDQG